MEAIVLTLFVLALAYANGANDVSKGVGTLVGSGLANYRTGLTWGTAWTTPGGFVAVSISVGLITTFSTGLLAAPPADLIRFLGAVAVGAFGWVIFASRTALPVSTTHAMAGTLVGAGIASAGLAGVRWPVLLSTVALPLLVSPLLSAAIAFAVQRLGGDRLSRGARYCVRLERFEPEVVPVVGGPQPFEGPHSHFPRLRSVSWNSAIQCACPVGSRWPTSHTGGPVRP